MSSVMKTATTRTADPLLIDGVEYQSRLLVGTGKYKDMEETRLAIEASGAEIITVAIRRTNIGQKAGEPNLLEVLPPERYTYLPNTAGCYSAEDAVRTCRLARELLDGHNLVKLEVLGDEKTLFPDITQTLSAAETLIADGAILDGIERYPREIESAVYFSVLEALQNTTKYANAGSVTVTLSGDDGMLTFVVADDGDGFDTDTVTRGAGLNGIADRLDTVGGTIHVDSAPRAGTTITGAIPLSIVVEA